MRLKASIVIDLFATGDGTSTFMTRIKKNDKRETHPSLT